MHAFISEDDIEQALVNRLVAEHGWQHIECDPSVDKKDETEATKRDSVKQCVLPDILHDALCRLNPSIDPEQIENIFRDLSKDFSGTDIVATNYKLYQAIREGIKVNIRVNGKDDFDFVKLIDFDDIDNNTFTVVNQMWIQGHYNYRRPDVLLFVNGLPIVFIELKNSTVKVNEAYNKNLLSYCKDIPNIFAFNQICVLSNGLETRIGAFNAGYEYFFEWLRINSEKEHIDRDKFAENGVSIVTLADGLLAKERLLDYIENFIFFDKKTNKIIAKNHQYLGVNALLEATKNRENLNGKLGVFWHTQGSGKSYSMVFYVRKVRRKLHGNWSFLIVTDREDLDTQIHKTFVRTDVIGPKDECQPKNSAQLREFLQGNKPILFTLIHKFGFEKTQKYPLLSTRNDIIVLVDEAHRTQYKQLAENMHTGLPNANYVAFTGTPLLGATRLTNQWFGDYVSEYNFAQAIEDKATVPLFYSRRVPEVGLDNNFLDDDVVEIIEEENLNEREQQLLENSSSRILEVIKREERLDRIAKDIAHHFPRRGFLGKGMVVSVDKYTAVRMYDKVSSYWAEERKALVEQRNKATGKEKDEISMRINFMDETKMAVVISYGNDDVENFQKQGLDLSKHIKYMEEISSDGLDIEERFKDPNNPFRLVFVCAMWLTGFDVPSLSTLYLDKPMKSHTLMQAIARANRVSKNKTCGVIVDYVNVFKYMRQALSDYASSENEDNFPAKDIDQLLTNLDNAICATNDFLTAIGISLKDIVEENDTFDKLDLLRQALNTILTKDDYKERFKVLTNTVINLYNASKPEVFEKAWENPFFAPIAYMNGQLCNQIDDEKLLRAKHRMANLLDSSVSAQVANDVDTLVIYQGKVIDLSKLDVDGLRKEINATPYKALEIDNLRAFIEQALEKMINKNCTRIAFSQRYKSIIDRYNAGGSENEDYYEKLLQLINDLKNEQSRADSLDLSEEELEIYDLLIQGRKLTKAEEQRVILAAKNLYNKLLQEREEVMVVDWYKDEQPRQKMLNLIADSLDKDLPDSYDKAIFDAKSNLLLSHFIDMAIQGYGWLTPVA